MKIQVIIQVQIHFYSINILSEQIENVLEFIIYNKMLLSIGSYQILEFPQSHSSMKAKSAVTNFDIMSNCTKLHQLVPSFVVIAKWR